MVVINSDHNHPLADKISALVDHCQQKLAIISESIGQLVEAPAQILYNLQKKNLATSLQIKDFYNARAKL